MMSKSILYIGNDLAKRTKYSTMMQTLSDFLETENYTIIKSSSIKNKILRLLDMCWAVISHRNKVDYILIDTFSTQNFYYALLTSQIARVFKLKYIPILHGGNLPHRLDTSPKMARMLFKQSYKNVAPSNYLKTEFEKRGFETMLIPNILEIENYSYKERTTLQPNLLWVRAFKHLYNPKLAVEVLRFVKEKYPNARLCMVGPEKDDSYEITKQLIADYNLQDDIELTGVLPKEEWHKKAEDYDIFINTTNFDNTPVSIMEAMALGLPVVSTNVGGLPYLLDTNIDGILVERENAKAMGEIIINLLEDNNQNLAKNARKKVESFSWLNVKDKWFSILQ